MSECGHRVEPLPKRSNFPTYTHVHLGTLFLKEIEYESIWFSILSVKGFCLQICGEFLAPRMCSSSELSCDLIQWYHIVKVQLHENQTGMLYLTAIVIIFQCGEQTGHYGEVSGGALSKPVF